MNCKFELNLTIGVELQEQSCDSGLLLHVRSYVSVENGGGLQSSTTG